MSKRSERRTTRSQADLRTSPLVIGGLIVVAVVVVVVLIQSGRGNSAPVAPALDLPRDIEMGVTADGHYYRGSLGAKVVVITYEDLRCPYCRRYFLETEPQVVEQYVRKGLVREESRIVPILGAASVSAAEAAACAGEQGKFWEFRQIAFTRQPPETNPDGRANFIGYAETAGVDVPKFTACFDTQRYQSAVEQTLAEAQAVGVQVTPTLFVNGVKYEGVLPFLASGNTPGLKDILNAALGGG